MVSEMSNEPDLTRQLRYEQSKNAELEATLNELKKDLVAIQQRSADIGRWVGLANSEAERWHRLYRYHLRQHTELHAQVLSLTNDTSTESLAKSANLILSDDPRRQAPLNLLTATRNDLIMAILEQRDALIEARRRIQSIDPLRTHTDSGPDSVPDSAPNPAASESDSRRHITDPGPFQQALFLPASTEAGIRNGGMKRASLAGRALSIVRNLVR
jgi:hypothetical protein